MQYACVLADIFLVVSEQIRNNSCQIKHVGRLRTRNRSLGLNSQRLLFVLTNLHLTWERLSSRSRAFLKAFNQWNLAQVHYSLDWRKLHKMESTEEERRTTFQFFESDSWWIWDISSAANLGFEQQFLVLWRVCRVKARGCKHAFVNFSLLCL